MSVFSNLDRKARRIVFSGAQFPGDYMPSGSILPDGSILSRTREGWNTFRMEACPSGKSPYGSCSLWRCDVELRGDRRIAETAIELREVVIS